MSLTLLHLFQKRSVYVDFKRRNIYLSRELSSHFSIKVAQSTPFVCHIKVVSITVVFYWFKIHEYISLFIVSTSLQLFYFHVTSKYNQVVSVSIRAMVHNSYCWNFPCCMLGFVGLWNGRWGDSWCLVSTRWLFSWTFIFTVTGDLKNYYFRYKVF